MHVYERKRSRENQILNDLLTYSESIKSANIKKP